MLLIYILTNQFIILVPRQPVTSMTGTMNVCIKLKHALNMHSICKTRHLVITKLNIIILKLVRATILNLVAKQFSTEPP